MKILSRKIFQVEDPDFKAQFDIYSIQSKQELKELINKFQVIRALFDGKKLYAWDAAKSDHTYVSGYLATYEPAFKFKDYIGLTLNEDGLYDSFVKDKRYQEKIELFNKTYFPDNL